MEVTVLIENTAPEEYSCEHGLSFWIAHEGQHYLLDSGSTPKFLENAEKLQLPLEDTDICFLSHGHYDHSGGFVAFFERFGERPLYAMKQVGTEYYSNSGGALHPIGVPEELFQKYHHCFRYQDAFVEVGKGVAIVPHHKTACLETIGKRAGLYRMEQDQMIPDDFAHEMSVVFSTEEGLVIFNSCSHSGLKQILEEVIEAFPKEPIRAFFGGLHMKGKSEGVEICTFSEEEIAELTDAVKLILERHNQGISWDIYTGHCTGMPAFRLLKKYLGERVHSLSAGDKVII